MHILRPELRSVKNFSRTTGAACFIRNLVRWRWLRTQKKSPSLIGTTLSHLDVRKPLAMHVSEIKGLVILTCIAVTLVDQLNVVCIRVNASCSVDVLPRDAEMLAAWIAVAQIPIERFGSRSRINRTIGTGFTRIAFVGWIAPVSLVDNPDLKTGAAAVECHVSAIASILGVCFKEPHRVKNFYYTSVNRARVETAAARLLYGRLWLNILRRPTSR